MALWSAMPAPVAADGGSGFVSMANGYRTDSSRAPVSFNARIDEIAVERAEEMAAAEEIGHDFEALMQRFDEEGICWRGFGEIVARNGDGDFASFGDQWWNSAPHKSVMLGDYTHASGSRAFADGRWYAVMIFVKLCDAAPSAPFSDIGGSKFFGDILWLVDEDITSGCSATRFCPDGRVTRAQMASFIARALHLGATSHDYFRDDDGNKHETNINRFADEEITAGCDAHRYCPDGLVTRAQMATFLARALNLPPADHDYFSDDDGSSHEANINRIAEAGITGGCGGGHFCPDGIVTRGQMAAFLHRAFE
ncbi:MAG TPA: S-layer homology domain-containing protein [Candidatus Limnocylindria bacterium]|jgi:hypothetical protein